MIHQIGDFGLARDLLQETYYTSKTKGAKLPVKWMAPEVSIALYSKINLRLSINYSL